MSVASSAGDDAAIKERKPQGAASILFAPASESSSPLCQRLADRPLCGYRPQQEPCSEPTALAALMLAMNGYLTQASQATDWLASIQEQDGSVPVRPDVASAGWPTPLAVLAWLYVDRERRRLHRAGVYADRIRRAIGYILSVKGKTTPRVAGLGHDPTLLGWPWASESHSWVEPTALSVLALKAAGYRADLRAREGVLLLLDRQLAPGGWNYGNTSVLGEPLRPNAQSTAITLLSLLTEEERIVRQVRKSLEYLAAVISADTPSNTLAWSLMVLAAYGRWPAQAESWIRAAAARVESRSASPYSQALLGLAAGHRRLPFVSLVADAPVKGERGER